MTWAVWVAVALSLMNGGWMVFDGTRALVVGDYVTPRSGEHAGQLGPWAGLVSAIGIEPRSTFMKTAFLALGTLWLTGAALYAFKVGWAWIALVGLSVFTLWYLVVGTGVSLLVLGLVLAEKFWFAPS